MATITLLDMLRNEGLIDETQFNTALQHRVVYGGKIGTSLIELGIVSEEVLARFLSRQLAVPYVHGDRLQSIPPDVIALIPRHLALKYRVIPLKREGKKISLVMADPADIPAVDEIAFITGYIIRPVVAPEVRLVQALGRYYGAEVDERFQQIIRRLELEAQEKAAAAAAAPPPLAPAEPSPPEAPAQAPQPEEELEEAEVVTEQWTERIEKYSIDAFSRNIARVEDREELAEILCRHLSRRFAGIALMLVRGDTFSGWKYQAGGDVRDADALTLGMEECPVLAAVVARGEEQTGAAGAGESAIAAALGLGPQATVAAAPVKILQTVNLVVAAFPGDDDEGIEELVRGVRQASLAFEILILRERIMMS